MVVLTREDIINGAQKTTEYESKILSKTVTIRALTDGEYSQVEALKKDVGKIQTNVGLNRGEDINLDAATDKAGRELTLELDLKRQEEQRFRADCLTAAYGLSIEGTIRPDDIKKAPAGFASEVANEVLKLSKLDTPETLKEDVESFRET